MIFHISWTTGRKKLVDLSKWPEEWIYYGCSKICIPLRQVQVPKKYLFLFFFRALYEQSSKVSISREPYVILHWLTIQNAHQTHLSISV